MDLLALLDQGDKKENLVCLDLVDFQAVVFLDPLVLLGQQDSLESLAE